MLTGYVYPHAPRRTVPRKRGWPLLWTLLLAFLLMISSLRITSAQPDRSVVVTIEPEVSALVSSEASAHMLPGVTPVPARRSDNLLGLPVRANR